MMMNKGASYNNQVEVGLVEIGLKRHASCFQNTKTCLFVLMVSCHLLSVGAAHLTYLSDIHHIITC